MQLLVRFSDDHDFAMALRNALRDAGLYRSLPGYEATGAITISVFIVADKREAQVLTAGIGQSLYGLATVGGLRDRGYDVVATDVEEEGVLLPFSERHADVIVSAYPVDLPPYDERSARSESAFERFSSTNTARRSACSTRATRCRRSTITPMTEHMPLLAADLTFVRVNGGRVYSGLVDWDDETREPKVGDHVMVADGGTGPLEAVIDDVRDDGTIVLSVLAYATRRQAAS